VSAETLSVIGVDFSVGAILRRGEVGHVHVGIVFVEVLVANGLHFFDVKGVADTHSGVALTLFIPPYHIVLRI
jgi:hypothetical protein